MLDLDAIKKCASDEYCHWEDDYYRFKDALGDVKALIAEVERLRDWAANALPCVKGYHGVMRFDSTRRVIESYPVEPER